VSQIIRTSEDLKRHRATEAEGTTEAAFREGLSRLLEQAPAGLLQAHGFFSVPTDQPVWFDSGIDCRAGEAITLLSISLPAPETEAKTKLAPDLRLWLRVLLNMEAKRCIWSRIGVEGEPRQGARTSDTFVAEHAGRLLLAPAKIDASTLPAPDDLFSRDPFERPLVDRCVLAVRWTGDPLEGLKRLRAAGDVSGLLASEIARLEAAVVLPDGWRYPPGVGDADQFAADGALIGCYSHGNGALLMKDAALPFLPGTQLRWRWKIDKLPSEVAEDRLETHDYLSVAVEFDNGRDLTYYWSAELPTETGYHCPVPGWENRETHVVVRTGAASLGEWFEEERDLYADYQRHVGEPPPGIVRVWLLAVTFFQRREGACEYGRIELANGAGRLQLN
jgi:hypothetical protein